MADQPIAHWNEVPYRDVSGVYSIGVCAFDRAGIQGVVLGLSGGIVLTTIHTMAQNPTSGSFEYFATLPSGLPTGQILLAAGAVANDTRQRVLPLLPVNLASTYTTKYVDATSGNDTTGTGLIGAPYQTIKKALETLAGVGDGGRIYLKESVTAYTVSATPSPVAATTLRYVNIEAAPGAARANVKIGAWSNIGSTKVHLKGVTLTAPIANTGLGTTVLFVDDCAMLGTGTTVVIGPSGWFVGWSEVYCINVDLSNTASALRGVKLARGCTIATMGNYAWRGDTGYALIDSTIDGTVNGLGFIDTASVDNALVFNVSALNVSGNPFDIHCASLQTYTNCAFINLLTEGTSGQSENQIRDVSPDHLLIHNCGFEAKPFYWRCTAPLKLNVQQTVFFNMQVGAGDLVVQPTLTPATFLECHYESAASLKYGFNATTGSADYTGGDDYTPLTGSVLYASHVVPPLVRCDQEGHIRAIHTTVGPLRGVDEAIAVGEGPPSGLAYTYLGVTPAQVIAGTDGPLAEPISASWQGEIETFEVAESVYHIYQAPPEIPCSPSMAHFEVRAWQTGDPTDSLITGGHNLCVVEDLRTPGRIYLRNPKVAGSQPFSAMATAMNLCAPFAARAAAGVVKAAADPVGMYTTSSGSFAIPNGPTGVRPVIRYRGQYLTGLNEQTGNNLSEGVDLGRQPDGASNPNRTVAWAGEDTDALGGFFPIGGSTSSAPVGKGRQIKLSVVGATGNKFDRIIGPTTMGYGFKNGGVADPTYAPIDILYKDFTFSCNFQGFVAGNFAGVFQTPDKTGKTGRLRLYNYGFAVLNPSQIYPPYGVKTWVEVDGGAHFDFRHGVYPPASEHANYLQGMNAGLLRNATVATGELPDSWFIDLVLPNGTDRALAHMVDRPWDQLVQGATSPCVTPTPTGALPHKCRPAGKGIVLFEKCKVLQGSWTESASLFNMVTGADMTFILRSNLIQMKAPLGMGSKIPVPGDATPFGGGLGFVPVTKHERGILAYSENGQSLVSFMCPAYEGLAHNSARINENGFTTRRVVVIDHKDYVDDPTEKRMSFRGVEEVHLYSFDMQCLSGGKKSTVGIDELGDQSPQPAVYTDVCRYQFDLEGNLVYSANPLFGTPISNSGVNYPHTGRIYIYGGYPANPWDYSGWVGPSANHKMFGCTWPSTAFGTDFGQAQINSYAGIPNYLPDGLTIDQTTGDIDGTPEEMIGIDPFTGVPLGRAITSPLAYVLSNPLVPTSYTGFARVPILGRSSADNFTGGTFQMLVTGTGPGEIHIVHAPTFTAQMRFIEPSRVKVDQLVNAPTFTARVTFPTTNLQVDQSGDTITVRPPPFLAAVAFVAPGDTDAETGVQADIEVAAPTFTAQAYFNASGVKVFGAGGASDGPGALIGLRAGAEAIIGV